jgi:hypothetical protein
MATAEVAPRTLDQEEPWLRWGSWLMGIAAVAVVVSSERNIHYAAFNVNGEHLERTFRAYPLRQRC